MEYGKSIFLTKPNDPLAFVFTPEEFGACPDGVGDNTAALQKAIDTLVEQRYHGIIYIPEGTYRFSDTVQLWRGIRLFGYGAKRPVFCLADKAPGYEGPNTRYILHFRDATPRPEYPLRDAQNTSFYGGVRNIDFDLGHGNAGAVACRYRIAQLCSLEDIDFYINDAYAAVEMVGNEIERCRFFGGTYGIVTGETVPYWQFYLGDSIFDGQTRACISSYRAGLTMVRDTLRNAPYGVWVPNKETDNHYIEEFERLYMEDCRLENLAQAGVCMNMTRYPQNWLHARDVVCRETPMFYEPFGYRFNHHIMVTPITSDYPCYSVTMDMGLKIRVNNQDVDRRFDLKYDITEAQWSEAPAPDYVEMPALADCVNIRELGAVGDGEADDTAVFEKAIAEYQNIYVPMGAYRLTRGLKLRENTAIVGLHCFCTRLLMDDNCPGFTDALHPQAMFTAPRGGHNHVCGLSFDGGKNPGLNSVEWMAAPDSLFEDILFMHGARAPMGPRRNVVGGQSVRHATPRKGRDRGHTIWIHDGGAGVFKNIWTPDVWAKDGVYISDTENPGKMYLISVEHHLDIEVVLERVANWKIISLQTEEDLGSEYASSVRCRDCFDIEFANLFQYRVQAIDIQNPYASYAENCKNLQVNGIHVFSIGPTPFTNAFLVDGKTVIGDQEIGSLVINC